MPSIDLSSSHADDDIGGQPSIKSARNTDQLHVTQDDDFFIVKLGQSQSIFSAGGDFVANLRDVQDINSTNIGVGFGTNFVLTYNSVEDNFRFVAPDLVIDSAAGNVSGPAGFSTSVINALVDPLDIKLDDKIDLDAGTWS